MKNIKISTKLIFLTIILAGLTAFIGIYGVNNLKTTDESLRTVYEDRVVPLKQLSAVSEMYAVNIVDATHKMLDGAIEWRDRKSVV